MKKIIAKTIEMIFGKDHVVEDVTLKEALAMIKDPANVKNGCYYVVGTDAILGIKQCKKRVGWFTYTMHSDVRLCDGDLKRYDAKLLGLIYADKRIDLKDELKLAEVETILAENAKAAKAEEDARKAEKAELARVKRELEAKVRAEKQAKMEAELKAELEKVESSLRKELVKKYGLA